jgi:DNA-binding PadR family transcriptional regulator
MTPPVFAHGHLRLYLLSLLAESGRGMHGYELMQALGDRFGGTYVPSAGTIYPRLAKLEEEGLVTKVADGRKTVYAITDAGRSELAAREAELDGIENDVTDSVRRLANEVRSSVNDAMRTLKAELAAAAREARSDAREAGRSMRADPADTHSRYQLQRAEAAINDFRSVMRSELRMTVAKGEDLTDETVAALSAGLDALRTSVLGR